MSPDDLFDRKPSAKGSLAFIVRYRRDEASQASSPRFEIEDVELGDKRRFTVFEDAVAHMRARIDAFSRRSGATTDSNTPE